MVRRLTRWSANMTMLTRRLILQRIINWQLKSPNLTRQVEISTGIYSGNTPTRPRPSVPNEAITYKYYFTFYKKYLIITNVKQNYVEEKYFDIKYRENGIFLDIQFRDREKHVNKCHEQENVGCEIMLRYENGFKSLNQTKNMRYKY